MTQISEIKKAMLSSMTPHDLEEIKNKYSAQHIKAAYNELSESEKNWIQAVKLTTPMEIADIQEELLYCQSKEELTAIKDNYGEEKVKIAFNQFQPREKNFILAIAQKASKENPKEIHLDKLIEENNIQMRILNWTRLETSNYLMQRYKKRSRHLLNDEEIIDLYENIKSLLQRNRMSPQPQ